MSGLGYLYNSLIMWCQKPMWVISRGLNVSHETNLQQNPIGDLILNCIKMKLQWTQNNQTPDSIVGSK
jgi:hypothetical protein